MSCPWNLLPVSTSNGLPSQSNLLRCKQICPFSESDDLLSIVIWLDAAIFIPSTNDACLIQDPGIWCRNRRTCHLFNYIIFIWYIFCFPKINYLFTQGIILGVVNLFMRGCCLLFRLTILWRFFFWRLWTTWWGTLLFPLTGRFLSLLKASCTSLWPFIWVLHRLIILFRFLSLLRGVWQ